MDWLNMVSWTPTLQFLCWPCSWPNSQGNQLGGTQTESWNPCWSRHRSNNRSRTKPGILPTWRSRSIRRPTWAADGRSMQCIVGWVRPSLFWTYQIIPGFISVEWEYQSWYTAVTFFDQGTWNLHLCSNPCSCWTVCCHQPCHSLCPWPHMTGRAVLPTWPASVGQHKTQVPGTHPLSCPHCGGSQSTRWRRWIPEMNWGSTYIYIYLIHI